MAPRKADSNSAHSTAEPKWQTRRGKERTEELLRVAADLFLEKGYEATSVDEIIRRSGGSKSHLYRMFGGKEELFLAVVTYLCSEVQLSVSSLDLSEVDAESGLLKLGHGLVSVLLGKRHIAFQRLVFAEANRFPKAGAIWFAHGPQTTRAVFGGYIKRCVTAGTLRLADPDLAANQFGDMLSGHLLDRAWLGIGKMPTKADIHAVVAGAVALFLSAYGGEVGSPAEQDMQKHLSCRLRNYLS